MTKLFSSKKTVAPLNQAQDQINALMSQARQEARKGELFNAGGLSTSRGSGKNAPLVVTAAPGRRSLIGGIQGALGRQGRGLAELQGQVRPGFGRLTQAARDTIQGAERRAVGDIKETLGRRRVLGSSFGADAMSRTRAEFAQQENLATAEAFTQELQMSAAFLEQQSQVAQQSFMTELNELNLEANVAMQLSGKASQAFSQLAGIQSQALASLAADKTSAIGALQAGKANFLGKLISIGAAAV